MSDPREHYIDPLNLLKGTYATAYVGYISMFPPKAGAPNPPPAGTPPVVPEIGAYYTDGAGGFKQVRGYRLHSFAAHLTFDGKGGLTVTSTAANNDGSAYLKADHLGSPRINADQNGSAIARHDYPN